MRHTLLLSLVAVASACSALEPSEVPTATAGAQASTDEAPEQIEPAPGPGAAAPKPAASTIADSSTPTCADWPARTRIGVEDAANGAAIVFTTKEDIGALRARVGALPDAAAAGQDVRLDNVSGGVRMVFRAAGRDLAGMRDSVKLRARELSRKCGFTWRLPGEDEEPPKPSTTPPPAELPKPASEEEKPKPEPPKVEEEKPKPEDKPKPAEKPKPEDKPKPEEKPKPELPKPEPPAPRPPSPEPPNPEPPRPPTKSERGSA